MKLFLKPLVQIRNNDAMVVCIAFVGFEHIIYLSGDDLFLLCRCHRCHYYDYLASSCVVLTLADIGFVTAYVLQSQHDSVFFFFLVNRKFS